MFRKKVCKKCGKAEEEHIPGAAGGLLTPERRDSIASKVGVAGVQARVRSGYLGKTGASGNNYQKRWFTLDATALRYFEKEDEKSHKGDILLSDMQIISQIEGSAFFEVC